MEATRKREFTVENEYQFDRRDPLRWIISHARRYWYLPALVLLAAIVNNIFYSYTQIYIGRGFAVITTPGWQPADLGRVALAAVGIVAGQGLFGLLRNYASEFLAQRVERDARNELYIGLLSKDQTFHGRQRVGDIMARATDDVRTLNFMINPGVMLITDSVMGIIAPFVIISTINLELLLVPSLFLIGLIVTLVDYNRRLGEVNVPLRVQFGRMNAGLAEAISGIEVVKGNVQEKYELTKFTMSARRVRDLFVRQGEIEAFYLPNLVFGLALAGAFAHAMIMWYGGRLALGRCRGLHGADWRLSLFHLCLPVFLQPGPAGNRQRGTHPLRHQCRDAILTKTFAATARPSRAGSSSKT